MEFGDENGLGSGFGELSESGKGTGSRDAPGGGIRQGSGNASGSELEHGAEDASGSGLEHGAEDASGSELEHGAEDASGSGLEHGAEDASGSGLEHGAEDASGSELEHGAEDASGGGVRHEAEEVTESGHRHGSEDVSRGAQTGPFAANLLQDRVVLITGGGTGLGRAMAEQFAALGARLAIAGRREAVLKQAAEEMGRLGHEVFYKSCDVRDPAQVQELAEAVEQHYGRIDVLVNNAAGNFISPTERLSPRAVDAVLNIVLHGTFYTTLEVGKRWIAQGHGGTMLHIVTTYASTGSAYVVPSAAAKAGVLALTRSLAVEWARHGIRQVAIAPGPFPTEGAWARLAPTPALAEKLLGRVPLGRVGDPGELAQLAAFLISDFAGYINGEVVTIDGGEWLRGAGQFNDLLALSEEEWDQLAEQTRRKGQ